ncbi:HTH-type transcriptional repressor FabR [Alcanivorax sp. JB21]|uniref:HTH-type transcriptional repressor FabR n=1 Tax=Alcanivorax limicola TaxID=2874102 RepID=UPI001CBAC40F|nr:HTH-type transcriptional repressor FabR [Alcanivorax limicola]MBZ2190254.1 HTH-type transcriptional repressor FabR [Alcanivorax limicola]
MTSTPKDVSHLVGTLDTGTDQPPPDRARPHVGRRAVISREDLMAAALQLVGPHRSISTLSLREIARAAGIAPNSFYRHFRDVDELAVTLINQAGEALRQIIGEARTRAVAERSVVQSSIEAFMEQLRADQKYLHLLLREGTVGSDAFKGAVERQLCFFEEELCTDLQRLAVQRDTGIYRPEVVSRAITRLVFAMGAKAMDQPEEAHPEIIEQLVTMVRMIIIGTQTMAARPARDD